MKLETFIFLETGKFSSFQILIYLPGLQIETWKLPDLPSLISPQSHQDLLPTVSKPVNIPKVPLCWERLGLTGGFDRWECVALSPNRTDMFLTVSKPVNIPKVPLCWESRFSCSIPSANENKVITVHLYCLIILWLTSILYTINNKVCSLKLLRYGNDYILTIF